MPDPPPPRRLLQTVCVYAGSAAGRRPEYTTAAEALAQALAARGLHLVYGGGAIGLMGALADAALAAGVHVVGVIPSALARAEVAHEGVDDLRIVGSMHERKLVMSDLADAFIALPGGIGTLEELVETLSWAQLGIHAKPIALLDTAGYWAAFTAALDRAVAEGFLTRGARSLLLCAPSPAEVLDLLESALATPD